MMSGDCSGDDDDRSDDEFELFNSAELSELSLEVMILLSFASIALLRAKNRKIDELQSLLTILVRLALSHAHTNT